jgi:hypothetical protein
MLISFLFLAKSPADTLRGDSSPSSYQETSQVATLERLKDSIQEFLNKQDAKPKIQVFWLQFFVDFFRRCTRSPFVPRLPWLAQCGGWNFLRVTGVVHRITHNVHYLLMWGPEVAQLLRHCATNRKVTGSIPDGAIGIFRWHNPSSRTLALRLTQPLTEMSTRNISWRAKAAGAKGWQPCHRHVPIVLKSGSLNLPEPSGPLQVYNGIALLLLVDVFVCIWDVQSTLIYLNKQKSYSHDRKENNRCFPPRIITFVSGDHTLHHLTRTALLLDC